MILPKELKWGFPTQDKNNQEKGLAISEIQSFSNDKISSIVREAIQNSLDAAKSPDLPVNVKIEYNTLKLDSNSEEEKKFCQTLLSVKHHIELCKKKYEEENEPKKAQAFKNMLIKIEKFERVKRIPYLLIEDSGTIGMFYDKSSPKAGRLSKFIHADGENKNDNDNGGGANGIGKMAYFAMSPLQMVLVSTHAVEKRDEANANGKSFFSGSIKLVTHDCEDNDEKQYQYAGYIPDIPRNISFLPLDDLSNLPFKFKRKNNINAEPELGSSIFIIGCEPGEIIKRNSKEYDEEFFSLAKKKYHEMEISVLRNYWLAIYKKHLNVTLGKSSKQEPAIQIDNIDSQLFTKTEKVFNNFRQVLGSTISNYNPLPFIKAMAFPKEYKNYIVRHYELDLDSIKELKDLNPSIWGKVRFYLNVDIEFGKNMILGMRAPLMTVWKYKPQVSSGSYAGVLVCDEERNLCNQLLRAAEPATHDKWDAEMADTAGHGENPEIVRTLLEVIKNWVNEKLSELFDSKDSDKGHFDGLSKYLFYYNPFDPSHRDSNLYRKDAVKEQTSIITLGKKSRKPSRGVTVSGVRDILADQTDEESEDKTGGSNTGSGGNTTGTSNPTVNLKENSNGKKKTSVRMVPSQARCMAFKDKEDDCWKHKIVISGIPNNFDKIDLSLYAQGENSREPLEIKSVSKGKIKEAKILKIPVNADGITEIIIQFKLDSRPFPLRVISTIEEANNLNSQN